MSVTLWKVGNELCEVDDDPCCLYIRAKTLLGIPGRGAENEAAIKQVLESQKLTCELGTQRQGS